MNEDDEAVTETQPSFDGMNPYQREILFSLNRLGKHVYSGTVSTKVKATRRAKNKVAKATRKTNRPA